MKIINKFLELEDYKLVAYQSIKKDFEYLYEKVLKKVPHTKFSKTTKIHWSREWEYPWAIISSDVKTNEKVLDCGCGGSPLLPFLNQYGCETYGVDPGLFEHFIPIYKFYYNLLRENIKRTKKVISNILNVIRMKSFNIKYLKKEMRTYFYEFYRDIKEFWKPKILKVRGNNLKRFHKDPNKLGFKIKYHNESLDYLHFKDEFFDKIYCISVIEHLSRDVAFKGIKEMVRVLKKGGLLIITMDHDGANINPLKLLGVYQELIDHSGLELYGTSNFKTPESDMIPFNVIGFVLKK